jgi:hypothetical protein
MSRQFLGELRQGATPAEIRSPVEDGICLLERKTGFEPATLTSARWRFSSIWFLRIS